MLLVMECVIACALFALVILWTQYKAPIKYIMSYPPEIRKRVESLPQYKDSIQATEKKHISKKIAAVLASMVVLAAIAYFSGARTFQTAFVHVFILFTSVDLFDALVLDIGVFCHSRKLRIPDTEDMDKAYKDYAFHLVGAVKGIVLGAVLSLISAGMVHAIVGIRAGVV